MKIGFVSATRKLPAKLDASSKKIANKTGRGGDSNVLCSNVVLKPSFWVDSQLATLVYWTSQPSVILASINIVCVVLRVIDVLLGAIAAKSICSHLEFFGAITKAHEAQNPKNDTDGFRTDIFDSSDVHGLTVIPQPVTKIHSLYVKLSELLAACCS